MPEGGFLKRKKLVDVDKTKFRTTSTVHVHTLDQVVPTFRNLLVACLMGNGYVSATGGKTTAVNSYLVHVRRYLAGLQQLLPGEVGVGVRVHQHERDLLSEPRVGLVEAVNIRIFNMYYFIFLLRNLLYVLLHVHRSVPVCVGLLDQLLDGGLVTLVIPMKKHSFTLINWRTKKIAFNTSSNENVARKTICLKWALKEKIL